MKQLGEIGFTQRTATGQDDSAATNLYIVINSEGSDGDVAIMTRKDADEAVEYNGAEIVGYYRITHPCIMAGDWQECLNDFGGAVIRDMREKGLTSVNEYGTIFWEGK